MMTRQVSVIALFDHKEIGNRKSKSGSQMTFPFSAQVRYPHCLHITQILQMVFIPLQEFVVRSNCLFSTTIGPVIRVLPGILCALSNLGCHSYRCIEFS
jgi:aspartyl aminopeptidase